MIGLAEREERVPYSIASAPLETAKTGTLDFLIKIESSGRWGHQFDSLDPGAMVGVRGPFGSFTLPKETDETRFLFIAGGTGIAPLRSMICHAFHTRQRGRLRLLYSARTPHDFAYLSELRRYEREGRLEVTLNATREVPPRWRGERGRITRDRLEPLVDTPATLCFVCGPAPMVDDVPRMLQSLGIENRRIRIEEW